MQKLVDNVVSASLSNNSGSSEIISKAYGDLVLLTNPALEAARVEVLNRRLGVVEGFNSCQPLVMAAFTSEKDEALSDTFPKGQSIFFGDDKKIADADGYKKLVLSSYGNAEEFRTHNLNCDACSYSEEPEFLTRDQYVSAFKGWNDFRSSEKSTFTVDDMHLSHHPGSKIKPGSPIINVYVNGGNVIANHNAIWGGEFSKFARALIGMEFAKQNKCINP